MANPVRIEFYENNERIFTEKGRNEKAIKKIMEDLEEKYQINKKVKI